MIILGSWLRHVHSHLPKESTSASVNVLSRGSVPELVGTVHELLRLVSLIWFYIKIIVFGLFVPAQMASLSNKFTHGRKLLWFEIFEICL